MGNKLKEVFDNKEIIPKIKMQFKDKASEQEFFEKLNSGETFDAAQMASVFSYLERGDEKYVYRSSDEDKLFIYPEPVENTVEYQYHGKNKKIVFIKEQYNGKTSVRNKENEIVELRMVFEGNKVNINCTANYNNASSMKEIYNEFEKIFGFLQYLSKKGKVEEDYNTLLDFLIMRMVYYKRVIELEKKLKIDFNPKNIENTPEEVELLELVYFWIVKNKVIKNNQRLNHFAHKSIIDAKEWVEGKAYNITGIDLFEGDLYGVKLSVYILNCFLNAVVSKKETVDGRTVVYFEEKDSMPMVNARKGFLSEKNAEKERDDLEISNRKALGYQKSLYLSELSKIDLEERKNKIID